MKNSFLILIFISFLVSCQEKRFPEPIGVVNDFESVFSEEEKQELTTIILDFEKETSNEIAIASLNDIQDYEDFNKYTLDL